MKILNIHRIFELVFGSSDFEIIIVGIIFAIFGAILSLLLDSNTRNVDSCRTPKKYSYYFLLKDNSKRIVITLILICVFMRFTKELLGIEPSVYWSFFIGFSSDKLSEYLKTVKKKFFDKGGSKFDKGNSKYAGHKDFKPSKSGDRPKYGKK